MIDDLMNEYVAMAEVTTQVDYADKKSVRRYNKASDRMPTPVSLTEMCTPSLSTATKRKIRPPGSVYFTALCNKLDSTCAMRTGSTSSVSRPSGMHCTN